MQECEAFTFSVWNKFGLHINFLSLLFCPIHYPLFCLTIWVLPSVVCFSHHPVEQNIGSPILKPNFLKQLIYNLNR